MTLLFLRDGIGVACYYKSSGRGTVPLPYALAASFPGQHCSCGSVGRLRLIWCIDV